MFKVMNDKVIQTSGKRIAAIFNSLRNNIRREVGYWIIKLTLHMEFRLENPRGPVAGIGDKWGELFSKRYFSFADEGFGGKGDRLIRRGFGTFPIKGFD